MLSSSWATETISIHGEHSNVVCIIITNLISHRANFGGGGNGRKSVCIMCSL